MVALDDSYRVVCFYRDDFHLGSYGIRKLSELLTRKLLSGVCDDLIGRT
jgi:hypothetical protein